MNIVKVVVTVDHDVIEVDHQRTFESLEEAIEGLKELKRELPS